MRRPSKVETFFSAASAYLTLLQRQDPPGFHVFRASRAREVELVRNILVLAASLLSGAAAAFAQSPPSLPASFRAAAIHSAEGAEIFVRSGGKGPVVVLVHGYAENSDSWGPLAAT